MGRAILQQPNGKLAVWSTITGDFVFLDLTWEELEKELLAEAALAVRRDIACYRESISRWGTTSYARATTWETAIQDVHELHGKATADLRRRYVFSEEDPTTA